MRLLGVDLASQAKSTAGCLVEWNGSLGQVVALEAPLSDQRIVELARGADLTAIDAPLGWPIPFVRAVASYGVGARWEAPPGLIELRIRQTDRWIHDTLGKWPLSVSTDLISMVAIRAARVLTLLGGDEPPPARDGSGRVIEVYPAAAMSRWGLSPKGYKSPKSGAEVRHRLVQHLETAVPKLRLDAATDALVRSDHAFDALVAALVARAFALGKVEPIPDGAREAAPVEGWIWLPSGSLGDLATPSVR